MTRSSCSPRRWSASGSIRRRRSPTTTPTTGRGKGVHAPDALLGLANSLIAINEKKAACDTLTKLRAEFPAPRPDLRDAAIASAAAGRVPVSDHCGPRIRRRHGAARAVRAGATHRGRACRAAPTAWPWRCWPLPGRASAAVRCWRWSSIMGCARSPADEAAATVARLGARGIAARLLATRRAGARSGAGRAGAGGAVRRAGPRPAPRRAFCICCSGTTRATRRRRVLIRALGGSGPAGLAGMAPLVETTDGCGCCVRCWRCRRRGCARRWRPPAWRGSRTPRMSISAALRPRLRLLRRDRDGDGLGDRRPGRRGRGVRPARGRAGPKRSLPSLAEHASCCGPRASPCCPGGRSRRLRSAALLQALAGAPFPPADTIGCRARRRRRSQRRLAGVRLLPAGRLGPGLLAVREPAAMAPPVPARAGAVWDGRFRLGDAGGCPAERDARRAGRRCGAAAAVLAAARPPCCGPCRR